MKKLFVSLVLCVLLIAPAFAEEPIGIFFQNTTHPLLGVGATSAGRVGKAECVNFFAIVSLGNCSVEKAMKNGHIRSLSHVDQDVFRILGFARIETRAFGN